MEFPLTKPAGTGQWTARLEMAGPKPSLRVYPEPGWPAPSVVRERSLTVVFDGRLFDDTDLRRSLSGTPGRIDTDAELLLRGYEIFGERLFAQLKGWFSLLVLDAESSTFSCVRDAVGVHPLFWAKCGRDIAVSSWIDALVKLPEVSTDLDRVVTTAHLLGLLPGPEETHFTAIRRIPPGCVLQVRRGHVTSWRHWDPAGGNPETSAASPEEFSAVLSTAVSRTLDVGPAAIMLSGGVDSATVATAAAQLSEKRGLPRPYALSIVSLLPESSEDMAQSRLATALGLPHRLRRADDLASSGQLLPRALELAKWTATPPAPLAPVHAALVTEARERGCHAVLTGDGGDEWLIPPPSWTADRLLHLDVLALYRLWQAWSRYLSGRGPWRVLHGLLWNWGVRPVMRAAVGVALERLSPAHLRRHRNSTVLGTVPDWIAPSPALRREVIDWAIANSPEVAPQDLYEHSKRELVRSASLSLSMEEAFVNRRRFSTYVLKPLLDSDVIEFLYRLPPEALIDGGQTKSPARAFLSRSLPFAVDWPKADADPAWQLLMRREGATAWRALGSVDMLSGAGIVDERSLSGFIRDGMASVGPRQATLVWELMSLESWLKARIVGI